MVTPLEQGYTVMDYVCPLCKAGFAHRTSLHRHLKRHKCPDLSSTDDRLEDILRDAVDDERTYDDRLAEGFKLLDEPEEIILDHSEEV